MIERTSFYCRERCDERFDTPYDRMLHEESEARRAAFDRRERELAERAEEEAYFEAQAADAAQYEAYCREMDELRYSEGLVLVLADPDPEC